MAFTEYYFDTFVEGVRRKGFGNLGASFNAVPPLQSISNV